MGDDRDGLLILSTILLLAIVLPLLILEAPWLLALAMVLLAGYWWQTGENPVTATVEAVRGERESTLSGESREDAGNDPVAALRERYARGQIDEEEFERRLDRLLATEPDELHRERERTYER